jgi:DNA-directed RNA polymerase subunit RPC12/RpoP
VIEHEQLISLKDPVPLGRWLSQNPEWKVLEDEATERRIVIEMSVLGGSPEEPLQPRELPFVCPECGARLLEECCCSKSPVTLYDDGSVELGDPDHDEDYYYYQCRRCGWKPVDEKDGLIQDPEALFCFLRANLGNSSNP